MKKAIIDLGTNTFNLLVGEISDGKIQVLRTDKEATLLGMGGINVGKIAEGAWDRSLDALSKFKSICEEEQVESILGFGTSAVREASNGDDFRREVKRQLDIDIRVISGEEEARLIYNGVRLLHDFEEPGIIIDIGGGSTEFVLADSNGIEATGSFKIGVSRIYQNLGKTKNFKPEDYKDIERFLEKETHGFFDLHKTKVMIGASGSFESLYEMIYKRKYVSTGQIIELPFDELIKEMEWLLSSSYDQRIDHKWIISMRKRMIPIAAFKIMWVIKKLGIEKVLLSPYSLKEGAFFE